MISVPAALVTLALPCLLSGAVAGMAFAFAVMRPITTCADHGHSWVWSEACHYVDGVGHLPYCEIHSCKTCGVICDVRPPGPLREPGRSQP